MIGSSCPGCHLLSAKYEIPQNEAKFLEYNRNTFDESQTIKYDFVVLCYHLGLNCTLLFIKISKIL